MLFIFYHKAWGGARLGAVGFFAGKAESGFAMIPP
jgi:hypothetical protein